MKTIKETLETFKNGLRQLFISRKSKYLEYVKEMNILVNVIAVSSQFGNYNTKAFKVLEEMVRDLDLGVHVLKVKKDGEVNLDHSHSAEYNQLLIQLKGIGAKKIEEVRQQHYETASQFRDKYHIVLNKIALLIQQELDLEEGFNYYKGSIIMVVPTKNDQKMVLDKLMQMGLIGTPN